MTQMAGILRTRFRASAYALVLACAIFARGCGPAVIDLPSDANDGNASSATVFAEDADPALADARYVSDELILMTVPGAAIDAIDDALLQAGAKRAGRIEELSVVVADVPGGDLAAAADVLATSPVVEGIAKNYVFAPGRTPSDAMLGDQLFLEQIGAFEAWNQTIGSNDITIAVIDTGVDIDHPDLATRIEGAWNAANPAAGAGDPVDHGTMVAGVLGAATDNDEGVAGVTWNPRILAIRAGGEDGLATSADLALASLQASQAGANVINMSFAPLWSNRLVRSAARTAAARGSLVVISSGNAGHESALPGFESALFVGAVTPTKRIASFSNRGPFIDLVAPGVAIRTTAVGGAYASATGTSFAAPIVSGVAALVLSINPDLRPASVAQILIDSATDLGLPGDDDTYGAGFVSAEAAVLRAQIFTELDDDEGPEVAFRSPRDGAEASGFLRVDVSAADPIGIADVTLSADGAAIATDRNPPYRFIIDADALSAGDHILSAVATDQAGNASEPQVVTIRVEGASSADDAEPKEGITFRSPAPGTIVRRDVLIQAAANDPDGLALAEWFVNGEPLFATQLTGTSTGLSYLWRASEAPAGEHTITLAITDAAGRRTLATLSLTKS